MTSFRRGELTDHLIAAMTLDGLLVGDGKAPEAGGWDDDPNKPTSSYSSYVVVMPANAVAGTGSIGDPSSEWVLPFILTAYGVSRDQVEWVADEARGVFMNQARQVVNLGTHDWKITQTWTNQIGGVARNDSMEPSEFSQIDSVSLRISKQQ